MSTSAGFRIHSIWKYGICYEMNKKYVHTHSRSIYIATFNSKHTEMIQRNQPASNAFTVKEWVKESEKFHLTIDDVLKFKKGERVKLLHLDRNFYDLLDYEAGEGVHKASKITRGNYFSEYTKAKDNDIAGSSTWLMDTKECYTDATRWHVDLGHIWYGLNEGYVPRIDVQGIFEIGEHAGKHWTALPKDTCIGWRGPCILAADIDKVGCIEM